MNAMSKLCLKRPYYRIYLVKFQSVLNLSPVS